VPTDIRGLNARLIGQAGSAQRLATPALVIDLPALERNIGSMQAWCNANGLKLRPHAKTHKSAEIARRQIAAGAVGVCCAKLGEAEALADAGIDGILVTSPVVTPLGFERVAQLNTRLDDFMIVVDSATAVDGLAEAAMASGKVVNVLLDLDIGLHRTGVMPGAPAIELARRISSCPGLSLRGLQAYAGHLQHVESHADRRARTLTALKQVSVLRDALAEEGITCNIISGGGTGTFTIDAEAGVFTEIQAGSYVFMDKEYGAVKGENDAPLPFDTALFVHTTVISSTLPGLVTTDAGLKSFATEAGPPVIASGAFDGASYFFFGDEQGGVMLGAPERALQPGSIIRCTTPHCDPTVNLYDQFHVIEDGRLSAIWPIEARGRSA
jgi:3-hydroxy-D-aspartate aldolase